MEYIKKFSLQMDISALAEECLAAEKIIVAEFGSGPAAYDTFDACTPCSTKVYNLYNIFSCPLSEIQKLYIAIQENFRSIEKTELYVIQAWLNVFRMGGSLGKHKHFDPEVNSYHGYFCVNAEPSTTTYWLPDGQIQDVQNKNNQLVISKSDGDSHKTSVWTSPESPRITVAFDIAPAKNVDWRVFNHWIPI